jgi:hypothetical protein
MTILDICILIILLSLGAGAVIYIEILARKGGRDRPHDPEQLKRFTESAPYQRTRKK